jgi:hypothetical protein
MQVSKRAALAALSTAVLAGAAIAGTGAMAKNGHGHGHGGGKKLLAGAVAPSVPADPKIHGVAAGGAPWVQRSGSFELRRDGRLKVRVRGLVIPPPTGNGTAGPVTTVTASLYCGADTTGAVGTTPAAPLSQSGNARISGKIALPTKCLAPIVLVNPNGIATLYIAGSGFGG